MDQELTGSPGTNDRMKDNFAGSIPAPKVNFKGLRLSDDLGIKVFVRTHTGQLSGQLGTVDRNLYTPSHHHVRTKTMVVGERAFSLSGSLLMALRAAVTVAALIAVAVGSFCHSCRFLLLWHSSLRPSHSRLCLKFRPENPC